MSPHNETTWESEALRLHQRYEIEIVEACGLCPWAERARLDGRVKPHVVLGHREAAYQESLDRMMELAEDSSLEVAFLIYPRIDLGRAPFDVFVSRLREADASRHPLGRIPFMMAAFHPDAAPDLSHPERLIPFLRRTPDPTLQLIRGEVLDRVRGRTPQGTQFVDMSVFDEPDTGVPLRERIARTNLNTVHELGVEEMERRLLDIRRDRDASYAALAADRRED